MALPETRPIPATWEPDRRTADAARRIGSRVDDVQGRRIGTASAVMVDRQTGAGRWLLVAVTAAQHVVVPLDGLLSGGGRVWCPHDHRAVMSGPHVPDATGFTARTERHACETFGCELSVGASRAGWERRKVTSVLKLTEAGWTWAPGPRPR